MSKEQSIIANVYTRELREAATDRGMARKTFILTADERGNLVRQETTLPGPRVRIMLFSTRMFRVDRPVDLRMPARIQIQGNQNNPKLANQWLDLIPVWRKVGDHEELAGVLDERGSKIRFQVIDSDFEQQPPLPPAE